MPYCSEHLLQILFYFHNIIFRSRVRLLILKYTPLWFIWYHALSENVPVISYTVSYRIFLRNKISMHLCLLWKSGISFALFCRTGGDSGICTTTMTLHYAYRTVQRADWQGTSIFHVCTLLLSLVVSLVCRSRLSVVRTSLKYGKLPFFLDIANLKNSVL